MYFCGDVNNAQWLWIDDDDDVSFVWVWYGNVYEERILIAGVVDTSDVNETTRFSRRTGPHNTPHPSPS